MPLRPCLGVHGDPCGRLTKGSRCPDHQTEILRRREAARLPWTTRYGNDWQRKAKRFVGAAKAGGQGCVYCGQTTDYDQDEQFNPLQAGHIVAREDGGSNDLSNIQLECRRCNVRKKRSRDRGDGA